MKVVNNGHKRKKKRRKKGPTGWETEDEDSLPEIPWDMKDFAKNEVNNDKLEQYAP